MNKFFKVIWSNSLQCFVVTSELARNFGAVKSANSVVSNEIARNTSSFKLPRSLLARLISSALVLQVTSVFALDIQSYNPTDNDDLFGQHIISTGGQVLTNDASGKGFNALEIGLTGKVYDTVQSAYDEDRIAYGSVGHGGVEMTLPAKESITYFDPITQTEIALPVYNSDDLTVMDIDSHGFNRPDAVGDKQYVNMRIATVKSGGNLTVDIGSHDSDWKNQAENKFLSNFKNSNVFDVENGGTLDYDSKTIVTNNPGYGVLNASGGIRLLRFNEVTFLGTFTDFKGESVSVNDIEGFREYNDAVIAAIQSGDLSPAHYDAELAKAYNITVNDVSIKPDIALAPTDDIFKTGHAGNNNFIHAAGANARINIAKDANLQEENSSITLIKVENGATLTNDGEIGVSGNNGFSDAIRSDSAVVRNNGVLDVGTGRGLDKVSRIGGSRRGVVATGASLVSNLGIINVGGLAYQTYELSGIDARGTTKVGNYGGGVINVATTPNESGVTSNMYAAGIQLTENAELDHQGDIYIGRKPQAAQLEPVEDIAVVTPTYGILALDNSSIKTTKGGRVTVGSKARNAVAMYLKGTGVSLEHVGIINLNGVGDGSSTLQNIGVKAEDGAGSGANKLRTYGYMQINGTNSVGFKLTGGSVLTDTGITNINGGYDPVTKLANYGSWVEGENSKLIASGTTNLNGNNSVAQHVRDKGKIVITDTSKINFNAGEKQIGYYAYGAGTTIERQGNANQKVATKDSTLYSIDSGASFIDISGDTTNITASGEDSTAILVTGVGTLLDSGDVQLNVTGDGATAVKVEGGAKGILSAGSDIGEISGTGTTVGIVDGKYYGLDGVEVTSLKGDSVLTSYASLTSANTTGGASGYIARNGGKLDHQGTIDFTSAGSTGVLVDSGILANSSTIHVNGTGVHIKGDSTVTNSGSSAVIAVDGLAAYHVDSGASLALTGTGITSAAGTAHGVLLDSGATGLTVENATINMSATGSGSAIENKANIAGIALTNTRVNVGNGIGVHTGASMAEQNSGTITVNGSGTGILFENIDASTTTNKLDMSHSAGLVINVTSAQGKGLVTNSNTDLNTGVSVNVNNASGGSAIIVNGTTKNINQSGVLTSQSTTSSVVDIDNGAVATFKNSGTIQAASKDQKAVETLTGTGIAFTNQSGGEIVGHVNLMAGNNTVNLDAESQGTDFTTDAGDDTFNLNNLGVNTIGVFNSLVAGAGTDTLNIIGSDYNLSNPTSLSGFETVNLVKGTTSGANLTLDNTLMPLGDSQNDATDTGFNIDADSSLTLSHANDVVFASHLAGTGLVQVNLGTDKNFTFTDNNAADGFDGTVALSRARMELAGVNTQALSDATLRLDGYSNVHVGDGEQTIGGLKFNGGTLKFDSGTPGETVAKGSVHTTESMDLSGSGSVQVAKGSVSNDHPLAPTLLDILAQDDATTMVQLAASDTPVIGGGGALILKDQNDNVITDSTTADIAQNGSTVAKGTYDYRLTSGENSDGLYINYGLTEVELLTAGADALALNATGLSGNAADLSAKITGSGDLAIDTGAGNTVSLSNTLNDYVGNTDIRTGNLKMIADNVLGQTDVLSLAADSALDMNGKAQTVGSLQAVANAIVNLNGGALSLSHGGVSDGTLAGAGALNVLADTLTVNGANSNLSATTTVANGATVALNDAAGLGVGDIVNAGKVVFSNAVGTVENSIRDGVAATTRALSATAGSVDLVNSQLALDGDNSGFSGVFNIDAPSQLTATAAQQLGTADIADEGELVLNAADNWALANNLSGTGNLTKQGTGVVTLSGNAAYTGLTDIQAGGLMLGSAAAPVTLASNQVNVAKDAFLAGYGGVAGNVDNMGTLYVGAQNESGAAQTFTIGKDLVNSGTVNIGHGSVAGNVLNVNGNYTSNDGLINFNTVLGDDSSVTDKLVIAGNTAGSTNVSVTNAGGTGAHTLNGIELISVGGQSDGEFKQKGRIVAGAYDYALVRGEGGNNANWYLTNTVDEVVPVDPIDPVNPTDPTEPTDPENPAKPEQIIRPEAAVYGANLAAANTLFNMTLHDRLGETHYVDAFTGQEHVTSLWLRQVGGHNRSHDSSGQNKTQANRYVAQLGGDIAQWSSDGTDRFHVGIMGGYANQSSHTRNHINGYKADGSVEGYSTGLYGTWFQDNEAKTGAYVDSWALYNWFDNEVSGQDIASESYESKGVTASVETGYTWKLGERNERESYYIQPQAQVTWMGVTSDDHKEANGTNVRSEGENNIQTRLGVRAFIKGHSKMDEGKERTFEPFVEANWIHNTEEFGASLDGVSLYQDGTRDIGELKVGVEAKLSKNTNLWGNVAQQVGGEGYSDTQATVGFKMSF